ncbi:MAG: hypothetical protein H0W72_13040 [Planctomycetes bacterium]|nr:hypothetical protein [Planctomycetota bacterium]
MSLGSALRIALVLGWLTLLVMHVGRRVLPEFSRADGMDLGAVLSTQLDRLLMYDLTHRPVGGESRRIGTAVLRCEREDNLFLLESELSIDELPFAFTEKAALRTRPSVAPLLRVRLVERLDERFRLLGIEGDGDLGGRASTLTGLVDHRGLTGRLAIDGQPDRVFAFRDISREGGTGLELAAPVLPSGLAVGDRIRAPMIGFALAGLTRKEAEYTVETEEVVTTRAGVRRLLRVAMRIADKPHARLWADPDGTVYRGELVDYPLVIELARIHAISGERIWPEAASSGPQVPR